MLQGRRVAKTTNFAQTGWERIEKSWTLRLRFGVDSERWPRHFPSSQEKESVPGQGFGVRVWRCVKMTMFQGQKLASLSYRKPMRSRAALSGGNTEGHCELWGRAAWSLKDVADTLCWAGLVYCRCFSVGLLGECCNFSTLYRWMNAVVKKLSQGKRGKGGSPLRSQWQVGVWVTVWSCGSRFSLVSPLWGCAWSSLGCPLHTCKISLTGARKQSCSSSVPRAWRTLTKEVFSWLMRKITQLWSSVPVRRLCSILYTMRMLWNA